MNNEEKNKPLFISCQNKGFQLTFQNGFTISVQWGSSNYCSRRNFNTIVLSEMKEPTIVSEDAEIAIWDDEGEWLDFGNDQVKGFCSPDEVAMFINFTKGAKTLQDLKEILLEFKLI